MSAPAGFRRIDDEAAVLIVAESFLADVLTLELTSARALERWREAGTPVAGGRTTSVRVRLPGSGVPIHLRPLAHGGWLRGLTGRRFRGLERPLREIATASALLAKNVRVSEPVLALARRRGRFFHIDIGTRFVEPSASLDDSLRDASGPTLRLAGAAGAAVRRFHDAGGSHRDLHAGNLLVSPGDPDVVTLVDLDGSRLLPDVTAGRRMRELMRLQRSLAKRHRSAAEPFWDALFDAYTAGDGDLRERLLRRMRRERLRNALHALAWSR